MHKVSGNPETYTIETPTFTLKNPTQMGQDFTGWTEIGNKDTGIAESTEPKTSFQIVKGQYGDRIFTANWTISSWKDMSGDDSDDDKISQKKRHQ